MCKEESDLVPGRPGKPQDKTASVRGPVPGPKDPEDPGTKNSRDLTSPKVPGLENWKSPGTMETLVGPTKIGLNFRK